MTPFGVKGVTGPDHRDGNRGFESSKMLQFLLYASYTTAVISASSTKGITHSFYLVVITDHKKNEIE